jgi:hypothetical protein
MHSQIFGMKSTLEMRQLNPCHDNNLSFLAYAPPRDCSSPSNGIVCRVKYHEVLGKLNTSSEPADLNLNSRISKSRNRKGQRRGGVRCVF